MTVQNLYTQYLDGKITKQKFLYEVRRDQHLDMISSSNSFEDVVKILKNKSIISEKAHKEAKKSEGKQEVNIIAKTIDMVNPYEYTRGMNYELDIMDVPATSGDLSEDNVLKAQKKVLTNLTKNPQYYYEKLNGKGEVSDEWVEATKKEIDKIGKGKNAKLIREELEEIGMFNDPIGYRKSEPKPQIYTKKFVKATDKKGVYVYDIFKNGELVKTIEGGEGDANAWMNQASREELDEHGQYADRVADVNADSSPLKEKQEAIYKKYAESTGIPMENLMAMVKEAKAKKLQEVDDTPEEKKAKDLSIAAEKAKIAASNKRIQDLNQGK